MGKEDERQDARAVGDFKKSFMLSREILNRKGSKRLISVEISECLNDLNSMNKSNLIPENFLNFSVYGKRDLINKIIL